MNAIPVSPLSLNQLTRDYWGQYDASIIAQLAPLANDSCYQVKFYKAPADNQESLTPYGYVTYGMRITPGSIIFGVYLPCLEDSNLSDTLPPQFTVQVTDVSLSHKWFDDPVASLFLANFKPVFQADASLNMGSFPNLLCAPYPVVGSGQFDVEIQETSGEPQRIQLVFGVLEVCSNGS